jgi:hypothetical protein
MTQKAHRFKYRSGFQYQYVDYVTVPFQVWDVVNNRQLMTSFVDSDSSGAFKLVPYDSNNPQREYLFVNAVPYDPNGPNASIAIAGGERYKNINAIWPASVANVTWNPSIQPSSRLAITNGLVQSRTRTTSRMTTSIHVDQHNITIIPVDRSTQTFRIVHASDGGIATSTNSGVSWTNPNLGYNTSQFYGVDKKPGVSQYFGGTQDNGSWISPASPTLTSSWTTPLGGDGFASIWNYKDPNKLIGRTWSFHHADREVQH